MPDCEDLRDDLTSILTSSNHLLDKIFADLQDGISISSSVAPDQLWLSDELRRLLGYEPDEGLDGIEQLKLSLDAHHRELEKSLFTERGAPTERRPDDFLRMSHRSGRDLWVRCRGTRIDAGPDRGHRFVVGYQDVTELVESQAQQAGLVISLRDSIGRLERFAAGVAHDLRAPLRRVSTVCQLMDSELAGKVSPMLKDLFHEAVNGLELMENMVESVLNFTRASQPDPEPEPVAIAECVRQALWALEVEMAEVEVEVQDESTDAQCIGSPTQITRAIQNLVSNALQAAQPEVPLKLQIALSRNDSDLIVAVTDNGKGVPEEMRERIWKHFVSGNKRTGLGLSLVDEIMRQHGGRVELESEVGSGTTFRLILPIAKSDHLHPVPGVAIPAFALPS